MTANYPEIVQQLRINITDFRKKAEDSRKNADDAKQEAYKHKERANFFEKSGERDKAQESRQKQEECITSHEKFMNRAKKREKLADKWEELARDIDNQSSEVLKDIDKLENFLQREPNQNNCPEIRQLIKIRLLQELPRYKRLLDFCQD